MHLLSQKNGKTIIFSTHDLNVALSQADKIWLIANDNILEGAPEDLMLQGAFDHLFDSSAVQYNSEHGTYSFLAENRGEVRVAGDGIMLHYTKKALNRAGFSVSEGDVYPFLRLPSGTCRYWQLISGDSVMEFGSLYEFITWINDEKPLST
jgi:iron complex transport system ATP-binding protein